MSPWHPRRHFGALEVCGSLTYLKHCILNSFLIFATPKQNFLFLANMPLETLKQTKSTGKIYTIIARKYGRAYSILFRCSYFRKMLIFVPYLFNISINFDTHFLKICLIFWLLSMISRYVYGSNIPLKYTVILWYQQLYLRNKVSMF